MGLNAAAHVLRRGLAIIEASESCGDDPVVEAVKD